MKINQIHVSNNMLHVLWQNQYHSRFHAIWLRDNCHCNDCGDASIGRRKLKLSQLDLNITIDRAVTDQQHTNIEINWSDGHSAVFEGDWLLSHRYDDEARKQRSFTPSIWNDEFRQQPPSLSFIKVTKHDEDLLYLLHQVRDHGLCLMHQSPPVSGTLEQLAGKIGPIQESNFGRVQDLVVNKARRSIANDVDALKPHSDEPYRSSPPGILMFHCIETDAQGAGESIFADGFEIAEQLRQLDPDGFAVLTTHRQGFRRHFAGDVDLIAEFPVISIDEFGNICGIRINDRVAAPPCIDEKNIPLYYRAMQRLLQLTEDPTYWIKHKLSPGDIAVFDNHRILHGRTRLSMQRRRWLQWLQVERGDFYSTMRILSDKLKLDHNANPLLRGAY